MTSSNGIMSRGPRSGRFPGLDGCILDAKRVMHGHLGEGLLRLSDDDAPTKASFATSSGTWFNVLAF